MKFPSVPMEPVEDNGMVLIVPAHHPAGTHCPGMPPVPKGTVLARIGEPVSGDETGNAATAAAARGATQ
jgi:hypothetical protein